MRRIRAIVTAVLLLAGGLSAARAAEDHIRTHAISAPRGFFLGQFAILTQDHHIAGSAVVLVVQDGNVFADDGSVTVGSWYEVLVRDTRPGDEHYAGGITSPIHIQPGEPGRVRVSLGDFGDADLLLTPRTPAYDRCCLATLFTGGMGYVNISTGAYDKLSFNLLLNAWQGVDVEGTVGDLIVTNNVPADVEHIGGVHLDSEIALAANGTSMFTTNIEGSDHESDAPSAWPSPVPTI